LREEKERKKEPDDGKFDTTVSTCKALPPRE
jgi:hypothetical protein